MFDWICSDISSVGSLGLLNVRLFISWLAAGDGCDVACPPQAAQPGEQYWTEDETEEEVELAEDVVEEIEIKLVVSEVACCSSSGAAVDSSLFTSSWLCVSFFFPF